MTGSAAASEWRGSSPARTSSHSSPGRDLGDAVLVPAVAVRDGAGVFLDDLAPADLAMALRTPVIPVEPTPAALVRALVSPTGS